ncbi:rhodanese-like domain-containing protein [Olleya sp. R77988]|uniref:rhodanese-like domain-containing protein n=1 Tax=Olleya sp. R77988 TaxID=3093875 RepID=UPI0037CB2CFE
MKKVSVLICLSLVFFIFNCKQKDSDQITEVNVQEMQDLMQLDNVQFVDIRTPKEFKAGYIAEAQNINFNSPTFTTDILKLDKDKPVLLYCHSGGRSAACAEKMKDLGFKKVYDFKGGFSKWKHEGLPYKK